MYRCYKANVLRLAVPSMRAEVSPFALRTLALPYFSLFTVNSPTTPSGSSTDMQLEPTPGATINVSCVVYS